MSPRVCQAGASEDGDGFDRGALDLVDRQEVYHVLYNNIHSMLLRV